MICILTSEQETIVLQFDMNKGLCYIDKHTKLAATQLCMKSFISFHLLPRHHLAT